MPNCKESRDPESLDEESGFTLIELVFAMLILSIFLTIVVSSVVAVTGATTKTQVTAQSTSAELAVFQRFDRQIRYADAIAAPGVGTLGDRYLEFRTPADSDPSGKTTCTQWRFDPVARTISSRHWVDVQGTSPVIPWVATTWETDLTNVATNSGAGYPFSLTPASYQGSAMQQLVLTLHAGNGAIDGATVSTTFVARNSNTKTQDNGGLAICPAAGDRP